MSIGLTSINIGGAVSALTRTSSSPVPKATASPGIGAVPAGKSITGRTGVVPSNKDVVQTIQPARDLQPAKDDGRPVPVNYDPRGLQTPTVRSEFDPLQQSQTVAGIDPKPAFLTDRATREAAVVKASGVSLMPAYPPPIASDTSNPTVAPSESKSSAVSMYRPDSTVLEKLEETLTALADFQKAINPDPSAVKFSYLRIPVWAGTAEQLTKSVAAGGVSDKEIPVGRYLFTFNLGTNTGRDSWSIRKPFPFTASGKRMIFHAGQFDARTGLCRVEIEVVENLIPLLIVAGAGLAALGFAGYGMSSALTSVDKIINDIWKIVLAGAVGVVAWWLWKRRKAA